MLFPQGFDKVYHCCLLQFVERVLWGLAILLHATNVTDADAPCVLSAGMRTYLLNGSACMHRAVDVDDIVVADVSPSALEMPLANGVDGDMLTLTGSRAMQNNLV